MLRAPDKRSEMTRSIFAVGAAAMSVLSICAESAAQTVYGQLLDANTQQAVGQAAVAAEADGRIVASAVSDDSGNFTLFLPGAGTFVLRARRIGYADAEHAEIQVGAGASLEIRIVMIPEAVSLDPLVARGSGGRLPRDATVDGLYARRQVLPRVGTRRVLIHSDWEIQSAISIGDVLDRYLQVGAVSKRRCVDWFVNGMPLSPFVEPEEYVRGMSTTMIEGLEYYRDDITAPLELQGQGSCRQISGGLHSIIAVWFRQ